MDFDELQLLCIHAHASADNGVIEHVRLGLCGRQDLTMVLGVAEGAQRYLFDVIAASQRTHRRSQNTRPA